MLPAETHGHFSASMYSRVLHLSQSQLARVWELRRSAASCAMQCALARSDNFDICSGRRRRTGRRRRMRRGGVRVSKQQHARPHARRGGGGGGGKSTVTPAATGGRGTLRARRARRTKAEVAVAGDVPPSAGGALRRGAVTLRRRNVQLRTLALHHQQNALGPPRNEVDACGRSARGLG